MVLFSARKVVGVGRQILAALPAFSAPHLPVLCAVHLPVDHGVIPGRQEAGQAGVGWLFFFFFKNYICIYFLLLNGAHNIKYRPITICKGPV